MGIDVKIYFACKMTGQWCDAILRQAKKDSKYFTRRGITVYHPVIKEGVPNKHIKLFNTESQIHNLWRDDEGAIKDGHVLVNSATQGRATGANREHGKARYDQWKPVVSIWPRGTRISHIAREEDDACVRTKQEAAKVIVERWGTRWKRVKWRFPIYLKHWYNVSLYNLLQFFR